VSVFGPCPRCGATFVVTRQYIQRYHIRSYDMNGNPAGCYWEDISETYEERVICEGCDLERPDLVCRNGRIEKREE
jgi:hypothetical protein